MTAKNISIELKALIFAVFIHIIIAEVFIFSFPPLHVSNKPIFIFWGSFLDPINKSSSSNPHIKTAPINMNTYQQERHAFKPQAIVKPTASSINQKNETKNFIKATFLASQKPSSLSQDHNNLPLILKNTKAQYKPLTIQPSIP